MTKDVTKLQQQGLDIILMIDSNAKRENTDGIIHKLINTCQLIETIDKKTRHPHMQEEIVK